MDIERNQLEIGEFSSDSAKASGCRSTPTVGPRARFGRWFRELVEPGKAYLLRCLPNWAVLCGQRRWSFHETCQFWSKRTNRNFETESSDSTSPWVEWCLLIRVIICWTHLLHQRLFTGQLRAVLNSATWWPTTAHVSVFQQSSLVLKLYCYIICKHSTFKRLFHNW